MKCFSCQSDFASDGLIHPAWSLRWTTSPQAVPRRSFPATGSKLYLRILRGPRFRSPNHCKRERAPGRHRLRKRTTQESIVDSSRLRLKTRLISVTSKEMIDQILTAGNLIQEEL